jgi:hypothetical protein
MTRTGMIGIPVALAALMAAPAAGQVPSGDASRRTVESFTACRSIGDDTRRLACFDKAASDLEAAVARKDVTIVDRQDIRRARRSLFGFTLPSFGFLGGGKEDPEDDAPEFKEINTTIKASRQSGIGRYEVTLDDGAVWETTEPLSFPPRAGAKVRIRQATLGAYFLRVDSRSVRARRVR